MYLRIVMFKLSVLITVAFGVAEGAQAVEVEFKPGDPATEFAASDLKRLLKDVPGKVILREDPSMAAQAWRLKTEGDALVISGRDGMGIVYGTHTFLEKYADIHWFAPDTESVPDLTGWKLPQIDESGKPAFSYREMFVGTDFMDGTWRLRNKEANRADCGVGVHNGSPFDSHTFAYYAKALKEKRPDLFQGRTSASGLNCTDLCMMDEETRDFVADEMCRYIESDAAKCAGKPKYVIPTFYDLSQNDGGSGSECMCPKCKAKFEAAGSYAGPNIAFASAVAERVAKRHPEVTIQTFAYSYTMQPPKDETMAADNVVVRYCKSNIFHPLLPGTPNGDELAAWSKHAKRFGIWSYWRTFFGTLFPCVQPPKVIAEELRFCRRLGVDRYLVENEAPLSRSFAMLQHWLMLKLTDDPTLDEKELTRKFFRGYYGKAAGPMSKYLAYLVRRQDESRQFLDREFFEKVNAWLDEAESLVTDDEKKLRHVRWERIVVDRSMYGILGDLMRAGYVYEKEKVTARFLPNLRDQINNWCGFKYGYSKGCVPVRLAEAEREAKLYAHYPVANPKEFDGLKTVTFEWNQIMPDSAKLVDDPDAAAGSAFYNPNYSYRLPYSIGYYADWLPGGNTIGFQTQNDVPQDEKFHPYQLGESVVMTPMYFHYDPTWEFRRYLQGVGIVPEKWQLWVSMKFQGPAYVAGSTNENRVLVDRAFYVKGADPMRGFREAGGTLVPEEFRSIEVEGTKAGDWRAKWFSLGDPKAMKNGFLVKGTVSYTGVQAPKKGVSRPFVGLWAITKPDGKNGFSIPCLTFFNGDYANVPLRAVITPDRLRRYVEQSGQDLELTFRVNMFGQEGATVKVENLEVFPIVER